MGPLFYNQMGTKITCKFVYISRHQINSKVSFKSLEGVNHQQEIKLTRNPNHVRAIVLVYLFADHQYKIAYIPALHLSAYGDTEDEAMEMLNDVLDDYCDELFKLPESAATEELEKYGWKMNRVLNTNFVSDSYVDKKGVLRDFNLPADTKITEKFLSTAA